MPLSGWLIVRVLGLDPGFAVGLILVESCPSGIASNVISFIAHVDVALAVAVTLTSTLLAFSMTPLWCQLLAGRYVPVDALGLSRSTRQVVVAPVLIGVLCNWRFPRTVSIEVGMQNGGMAAMLARKNFPTEPLAAVPAVFSAVIQNMVGNMVAAYWRQRPIAATETAREEKIALPVTVVEPGDVP